MPKIAWKLTVSQLNKNRPSTICSIKPRGVISAVTDDKKESCFRLFTDVPERLYPIGRLDYDTSGLLLLTNDGDLSQN